MKRELRFAGLAALLLLAAGCSVVPKSAPPPAPRQPIPVTIPPPPPRPLPPPASTWEDRPIVEGGWTYNAARGAALFVDDGGRELVRLACFGPERMIELRLMDEIGAGEVEVLTTAGNSNHALRFGAAMVGTGDIVLDRIAFSRGRFALRASSLLVLPVQAEIGRVIEDCRGV